VRLSWPLATCEVCWIKRHPVQTQGSSQPTGRRGQALQLCHKEGCRSPCRIVGDRAFCGLLPPPRPLPSNILPGHRSLGKERPAHILVTGDNKQGWPPDPGLSMVPSLGIWVASGCLPSHTATCWVCAQTRSWRHPCPTPDPSVQWFLSFAGSWRHPLSSQLRFFLN
jgi:hypothetical protein